MIDHLPSGKPLDPKGTAASAAERITGEIRQKHGELNIAVDLIREIRDEE